MKYLVKNKTTGEETLCERVEVDGWLYYIAGEAIEGDYGYLNFQGGEIEIIGKYFADDWLKVIATNNKSLDLLQVVDDEEELAVKVADGRDSISKINEDFHWHNYYEGFQIGYKQAKETYQFTKEDMVEFVEWLDDNRFYITNIKKQWVTDSMEYSGCIYHTFELLNLWQEQRIKTIIVE